MLPDPRLALNTVWIIAAAILVFFMQAGFALVEGGQVRSKNSVNVIMKNYTDMCVGALGFWAIGYGLMFGSNPEGWFGQDKFFLNSAPAWEFSVLFFQMMFAATAATIVSGALAERIRYSGYLVGSLLITSLIYPIFGAWAWNPGGWLKKMGFLDFAGSTVVHSIGAWCSLAGALVMGPRLGRFGQDGRPRVIPGHNLPMVALGGFILWFGWFGFNGGSTSEANADIGLIVLNTHLSASAATVSTLLTLALTGRPVLMTTVVNGGLGGLVAITAGCAYVQPAAAIVIGLIAGLILPLANAVLERLHIDDAVGAIPVHGFCGVWGTVAVALFKSTGFQPHQLFVQLVGIGAALLWTLPCAWLMYKAIGGFMALRVQSLDEQRGLDYTEHAEVGYPEFQVGLLHAGLPQGQRQKALVEE
jgi:Amt family ammonium transporter